MDVRRLKMTLKTLEITWVEACCPLYTDAMLAVNYSTIRNHLKTYCDKATDNDETVIVTRKDEKNVVIMSLEKYNQIMKAARNAEYLAMIDRGIEQIASGRGQRHELIEVEDDE